MTLKYNEHEVDVFYTTTKTVFTIVYSIQFVYKKYVASFEHGRGRSPQFKMKILSELNLFN